MAIPPAPAGQPPRAALLSMHGISKAFVGTRALIDVDLELQAGQVHALVGQNGSGKSTLIKILSGYHAPDHGTLSIDGQPAHLPMSPTEAAAHGLRFMHQNPGLVPTFSVLETIRLTAWQRPLARIDWRTERARVRALLADVRVDIEPDALIRSLTPSQQAVVAIVRALQGLGERNGILVLDEPTASLNRADTDRLFDTLRRLKERGHAILFVSHRLDEVLAIAERITVIRDGRRVWTGRATDSSEDKLISHILGRDLGALYPERPSAAGDPILDVRSLQGTTVRSFDLTVGRGEIVGITGLGGMGQDEVPYLIFGASKPKSGTVSVQGTTLAASRPREAMDAGMALMPADRDRAGGVRRATLAENVTMATLGRYFRSGWLRVRDENREVISLLDRFQVRPPEPGRLFGTLSGGNQQKTLLAKWLQGVPRVLLLHEPTQGVDVGSRQQVFQIIKDTADAGTAVVVSSVEYADLARICHRVIVMRRGEIATQLRGAALTEERLIQACYATG